MARTDKNQCKIITKGGRKCRNKAFLNGICIFHMHIIAEEKKKEQQAKKKHLT